MKTSALVLVLVAWSTACAQLTKTAAQSEQNRLKQLFAFSEGHADLLYKKWSDGCKAASETFLKECASFNETKCKNHVCSKNGMDKTSCKAPHVYSERRRVCANKSIATQSDCTKKAGKPATYEWQEAEVASVCCNEGKKQCKTNASGQEYRWGCCNWCATNPPADVKHRAPICSRTGNIGIALLGTEQGKCHMCVQGQTYFNAPGVDEESSCIQMGTCQGNSDCQNKGCCKTTFVAATWMTNTTAKTKETCERGSCGKCSAGAANDKSSCTMGGSCSENTNPHSQTSAGACTTNGGAWTTNTWGPVLGATSDNCYDTHRAHWKTMGHWKEGKILHDRTLNSHLTPFAVGPRHQEPSHILPKKCISQAQFLADAAAGKTAQQAFDGNQTYYQDEIYRAVLFAAVLSNNASAATRSQIRFEEDKYPMCFVGMWEPKSKGEVVIKSSKQSFFLMLKPKNLAGGDPMQISGAGTGYVLGGVSAGTLNMTSSGTIRVYGVTNSGPIMVSQSQDIVISNVKNEVAGKIAATGVTATLMSIDNAGDVVASGKIAAYDIKNSGSVTINSGSIELHLICPTTGTLTIKAGVTGNVSYPKGCKGTITNTAGIQLIETAGPSTTSGAPGPSTTSGAPGATTAAQKATGGGGFKPDVLPTAATEATLIVTTIIKGLDYDKLEANKDLKTKVLTVLNINFAAANGVERTQVSVALSKGSVKVTVMITAKSGETVSPNVPAAADLTAAVTSVQSINTVKETGVEIAAGEPDTYTVAKGATTSTQVAPLVAVSLNLATTSPSAATTTRKKLEAGGAFATFGLMSVVISLMGSIGSP